MPFDSILIDSTVDQLLAEAASPADGGKENNDDATTVSDRKWPMEMDVSSVHVDGKIISNLGRVAGAGALENGHC